MTEAGAMALPTSPPPFQGFHARGGRDAAAAPGGPAAVLPLQSYVLANDEAVFARGACTVYDADTGAACYHFDRTREHSLQSFTLVGGGAPLLRVAEASDRAHPLSAFVRGFFNPMNKYDILNAGLLVGLPRDAPVARVTEVYVAHEAKVVESAIGGPRVEVQGTSALGAAYAVTTTGVTTPWGEVRSRVAARFLPPGNERYGVTLRGCTRAEGALVLAIVMTMDMKRRKTTGNRWR